MSFRRFLRLGIEDRVPDGTTLWLFRETLGKAGLIEKLFKRFSRHLEAKGYIARGGPTEHRLYYPEVIPEPTSPAPQALPNPPANIPAIALSQHLKMRGNVKPTPLDVPHFDSGRSWYDRIGQSGPYTKIHRV
jgi:IS5 family transposase